MSTDLLLALVLFAFVTSVTPGPNNMMLLASGANFGLRRSVPHMLGITLGHAAMVLLVGLGLAGLLTAFPAAATALKVACIAYLIWLAWRIAHAAAPDAATGGRPMGFFAAALFQWVNPKSWAMALTAVTAYAPGEGWRAMLAVALVFACVNLPSVSLWAAAGQGIRRWLGNPGRLRLFNRTMAVLLVASTLPVVL
jgi:threonine/homoserine/homoserine lactone efflux protein